MCEVWRDYHNYFKTQVVMVLEHANNRESYRSSWYRRPLDRDSIIGRVICEFDVTPIYSCNPKMPFVSDHSSFQVCPGKKKYLAVYFVIEELNFIFSLLEVEIGDQLKWLQTKEFCPHWFLGMIRMFDIGCINKLETTYPWCKHQQCKSPPRFTHGKGRIGCWWKTQEFWGM